jgi:hypothetical protein
VAVRHGFGAGGGDPVALPAGGVRAWESIPWVERLTLEVLLEEAAEQIPS